MSTSTEELPPDSSSVTVTRDGNWFVAVDEATDVASQGRTRPETLANLAEALELHHGGEDIEDTDTLLATELDIDADELDTREPDWPAKPFGSAVGQTDGDTRPDT